MQQDRIPAIEECHEIIKGHMLPNILEHSIQVMNVSRRIIENLKQGIKINEPLVLAASLLHDIKKTESLETREPHDIIGAEFARGMGFYSIADIIEEHIILKNFDPEGDLLEKEIVYYADKRVMHEKIVTVRERMDDIKKRYGRTPEIIDMINKNTEIILSVEEKLNRFSREDMDSLFEH